MPTACEYITPLNMIAGGLLLLVLIALVAAFALWYCYHEIRAFFEDLLGVLRDQSQTEPEYDDGLTAPRMMFSPPPPQNPDDPEVPGPALVNWPPEPVWPDRFRQEPRLRTEEEEEC